MKLLKIICITVFTFSLSVTPAFASVKGVVNGDRVNVRQEASTSSTVLDRLSNATPVTVSGQKDDFYEITFNGQKAYIHKQFINIVESDGLINASGVNIRAHANTSSDVLGQFNTGDKIVANGFSDGWIKFTYNGKDAYINTQFVIGNNLECLPSFPVEQNTGFYAVVSTDGGLNLREAPSTESKILTVLNSGNIVDVFSENDEWVQVLTSTGLMGFVSAEFIEIKVGAKPERSAKEQEVVAYAKQFLGAPYAAGGSSAKTGFDCSGFVYSIYRSFGVTLSRSSRGMASNGIEVARADLAAGDLVLFTNGGRNIGHVGIYIGNGQYIHSSTYGVGVIISDLNDRNSNRSFVTARRILV